VRLPGVLLDPKNRLIYDLFGIPNDSLSHQDAPSDDFSSGAFVGLSAQLLTCI
jgi:hypothetical protein